MQGLFFGNVGAEAGQVGHLGAQLVGAGVGRVVGGFAGGDGLLHFGHLVGLLGGQGRDFDDVVAERGFHHIGQQAGAGRSAKNGFLELGHHAALAEPAEVAALVLGAVGAKLPGHGREVGAGLDFVEQVLGLGFRGRLGFGRGAVGLDEDVAGAGGGSLPVPTPVTLYSV